MKKLIITLNLILVIAFFSQPCAAQIDLVLGLTKSSITGSESWQDPIGFQVGAIIPVMSINEMISLRAEANLSLQGAKWKESTLSGRTNLLYLNVPVVVRYQTESGFFGEAGLQPGLLLSAKDKYEGTTESYMDHMNAIDLSIPLGVGYEFKNNFGIGFRVIPGISDITKDKDYADRNLVFALRGTYAIRKK
jgi:hypothetical protein